MLDRTLSFQISKEFGNEHCQIHFMGLSARGTPSGVNVKTCCIQFKAELELGLRERFGADYVKSHIRFSQSVRSTVSGSRATENDE